ncbi:MAG TPA: hypothetical protein VNZ26_35850, partial [Vicinamibacterales bacterium]|nr:hypothetical protein [Vicinamibacterales bacterium]
MNSFITSRGALPPLASPEIQRRCFFQRIFLLLGASRYALGLGCIAVGLSCASKPTFNDDAREVVRLAVALGERDSDSLDSYSGPPEWVSDARAHPPSLREIARAAANLAGRIEVNGEADADRRRLLIQTARAVEARANLLLGTRLPFDEESRALFGRAPAEPSQLDRNRFDGLRAAANRLLEGSGPLAERYARFERSLIVPPDRLAAVMSAALEECRRRTLVGMNLQGDGGVKLEYVNNKPWSAYSRYLGRGRSAISINTDFRFTVDDALQTACHEAYPGHHVRSLLLDATFVQGRGWPEFSVQLLFSPQSLASEGTAMNAADVAFQVEDRVRFERIALYPLAGLSADEAERAAQLSKLVGELQDVQGDVARRYLDGSLEFVRAGTALEEQALIAHPEATLKYINQYRSYVTAYTVGRRAVTDFVDSCSGGQKDDTAKRWRCFEQLVT